MSKISWKQYTPHNKQAKRGTHDHQADGWWGTFWIGAPDKYFDHGYAVLWEDVRGYSAKSTNLATRKHEVGSFKDLVTAKDAVLKYIDKHLLQHAPASWGR